MYVLSGGSVGYRLIGSRSVAVYVRFWLGDGVSGSGDELGWFDDYALVLGYVQHGDCVASLG